MHDGYGHLNDRGYERREGGGKKIALGVLFGIVVIAVVATLAVTVTKRSGSQDPGSVSTLSPRMQLIQTICSPTDYKDTCTNYLSNAVNSSSDVKPKDLVDAAIKVTIDEMAKALNHSAAVAANGTHDNMVQQALDICKEHLQYAVDELKDVLADIASKDLKDIPDRSHDIKTFLSAVVAYQTTCLDGFNESSTKDTIQKGLETASQLNSNALAIITELSTLFSALQIPFKSRRLLSDDEFPTKNGFPEWMSAADRKLLSTNIHSTVTPNVVVAKDGSGQFKTIQAAINAMPKTYAGRYVIYVKAGIYNEMVTLDKTKVNVLMYGDGPRNTMVTGNKNFVDGTQTSNTATFVVLGNGFIAHSMGFRNTAGAIKHQAVAYRSQSDQSAHYNCRFDGYQDTLYAQAHRQFYRNCVISGTIDFIFGDGSSLFQNCLIIVRKPLDNQENTVTAHGRNNAREVTGIVIQNCRIVPDSQLYPLRLSIKSYLGRPWKEYSRTVIMESTIGDLIQPDGWMPWDGNFALNTLYYAEFNNRGPGANTANRIKWRGFHVIGRNEAQQFTVGPFLDGQKWISATGAPYFLGFKF